MRIMFALFVVLALLASPVSAQVPRNVVAEDGTATWCIFCPDAYAGLEVMKNRYDTTEFTALRYYLPARAVNSTLPRRTPGITYYAVSGFPTVIFDGKTAVVGGGSGVREWFVLRSNRVHRDRQALAAQDHDHRIDLVQPSGSIDLDIEVAETMASIANVKVRMAILENNVTNLRHRQRREPLDVTRDMLADVPLTVSTLGQVQNISQTFPIDPTWKTADLWFVVFVQDDSDKAILQSASSRPLPAYSPRFWAKGVGPSSVPRRAPTPTATSRCSTGHAAGDDSRSPSIVATSPRPGPSSSPTELTTPFPPTSSSHPGEGHVFHPRDDSGELPATPMRRSS